VPREVELNGALSNPFTRSKSLLKPVHELHATLLRQASKTPRAPQPAPAKAATPVLETVTFVLDGASCAMRTIEIHAAAEELLGRPLLRSSVRGILSSHTLGGDHRFTRLRRGVYQLRE
jgi:hypothetical protein